MQIGLIGGIGPAETDCYFRRLISRFAEKQAALDLTIAHADTPTLLNNRASNAGATQVAKFSQLTNRLATAGAGCVATASIAGHFFVEPFKANSVLPVIDLISEVHLAIEGRAFRQTGILGTRTAMETRLYGGVSGVEVVPACGKDLDDVHQAYVAMAAFGSVSDLQRGISVEACHEFLNDSGVEAIMLGGTDLALVFNERDADFPLVDCAGIHADAIAKFAMT